MERIFESKFNVLATLKGINMSSENVAVSKHQLHSS